MTFNGFTAQDFATFSIDGLEERMEAIQNRIQPKFQEIGSELVDHLQSKLGNEMFLHIAKHARRSVNPPKDTWLAIANNKRGYKKHPHFQVGLWDDRVFVWLAYIYELPNKNEMAEVFLQHLDQLEQILPQDYDLSLDHMKKSNEQIKDVAIKDVLDRFKNVKSSELLIGKQFEASDPILTDGSKFLNEVKSIYDKLIPIYQMSLEK
ncbi:DUF1054 family protein [Virgibacillus dakarensis]|uniref:UPF0637 protein GCM10011409_45800 n=1 Tax=Lentibacillus populi TaxID=1827502 RepID=A0A9W5U2U5_9BACI|nr:MULTISPECIES: DUF1054 domain-containing protein [Bacillaceae]MBT2216177.1 DUF1054 family protein [Virgibacillus dakarensis]MTW85390.1 DUF1054 family protein [Virgibacillus dakarensis]GGB63577.1 UPF0637 protein [Lentibacillus populi]